VTYRWVAIACWFLPLRAIAFSAVFAGDPIHLPSGTPYEILPGFPLVEAGADGLLGTSDDIVSPAVIGDIDMVVRAGWPPATAILPAPQVQAGRATVPVGVAGSSAAGGVPVPFTVFLSDGHTVDGAPYGSLLTTSDMDGCPVVVAAFPDYDGDGYIGPTDLDDRGTSDNQHEVRELDPVGRGVAVFSAGVARGHVAVLAGLPASRGGLGVVLAGVALTGPFEAGFYEGEVPSGPAITSALPFLPQRDLARLFRDRAVAVSPDTTLQPVLRFAAIPSPAAPAPFALPLDGSSPTVDVAVAHSQVAVKAGLFEDDVVLGTRRPVDSFVVGTRSTAAKRTLRLMPADRLGNPADPPPGFQASVVAGDRMRVLRPRGSVTLPSADGVIVKLALRSRTVDGTVGAVTIEVGGAVVDAPEFSVDARLNPIRPDVTVPSVEAPTIQQAIAVVYDKRRDGRLVIDIAPGLYREVVVVDRPILLRGSGSGSTVLVGDGTQSVVTLAAPGASLRAVTLVAGSVGVTAAAADGELTDITAWRNASDGFAVTGAGVALTRVVALDNGGAGVSLVESASVIAASRLIDNLISGVSSVAAVGTTLRDALVIGNGFGVSLVGGSAALVRGNRIVGNHDIGIDIDSATGSEVIGNLSSVNDGDGIKLDRGDASRVSSNVFDGNGGYGIFQRRSADVDYSVAAGLQDAMGDNVATNNRKGDLFIRPD